MGEKNTILEDISEGSFLRRHIYFQGAIEKEVPVGANEPFVRFHKTGDALKG
jgi:hypothetical protein